MSKEEIYTRADVAPFLKAANMIIAGLRRGMYDDTAVAVYLQRAYKKGFDEGQESGGQQHHATYRYDGVF